MTPGLVTIADRPDLAATFARWTWEERGRRQGETPEQRLAAVAGRTARDGLEQCMVALVDGTPAGTASLVACDAAARPDLSPWLASLHVAPPFRGRASHRCW
jgi:uncharacterized protein (DUF849 family)